jgi:hypothetical protein
VSIEFDPTSHSQSGTKEVIMLSRRKLPVSVTILLMVPAFLPAMDRLASKTDPPLANWSAPASYAPPASQARIKALGDISGPEPFIPVDPCRQYDSRGASPLPNNTPRTISISGAPCGIPAGFFGAVAASVNITVFNISGAAGNGVFRVGTVSPPPTAWINFPPTETQRANAGVVSLSGGNIIVQVNMVAGQLDFTVDVNGYYASAATNPGNTFTVINSGAGGVPAILGQTSSASLNASGVKGVATAGVTNGVWGDSLSSSDGATGVFGFAEGTSGVTTGVWGRTVSPSLDARGVYGEALGLNGIGVEGFCSSFGFGVYGQVTMGSASAGYFINTGSNTFAHLSLGDRGLSTNGEIFGGSLDIIGSPKNFVSPHPLDPSKEIRYASVEAPTVDVYFRGTAALVNGYAHIDVPEHFRLTAREGTYMTTLTPVGRPTSLSVESEGSEGIVVRGSGNTRFHYVVYAERAEIEGYEPVAKNVHFTPAVLESVQMLKTLPASTKALLVRNGTLNADGSYNEETARAMGWTILEPRAPEAALRR